MTNDELIAALEKATGPDRELDCEIAVIALGGEIEWKMANWIMELRPVHKFQSRDYVKGYGYEPVLEYTSSIDVALTLVPDIDEPYKGAWWNVECSGGSKGSGKSFYMAHVSIYENNAMNEQFGFGTTAAIALCIAALKARGARQ